MMFFILPEYNLPFLNELIVKRQVNPKIAVKLFGAWFVFFFFIILFTACEKQVNEFSCDPEIENFVRLKQAELSDISIEELVIYPVVMQKAIFNSLTPQKKWEVWYCRYNILLNSNDFDENEKNHIRKLRDFISPELFAKENQFTKDSITISFSEEWLEYAYSELKWDSYTVAFLVYRLWLSKNKFYSEIANTQKTESENDVEPGANCNCNVSSDFCSGSNCSSGNCSVTGGCGWLWLQPCNGSCTN